MRVGSAPEGHPGAVELLVAGSSGLVGRRLSGALVEAGHTVRAMTRRPQDHAGAGRDVYGDVHDPASPRGATS